VEVKMALVKIAAEGTTIEGAAKVREYLAAAGIDYQVVPMVPLADDAPAADVLEQYAGAIEALKASGGYTTADVIDVKADTPGLDAMLARFNSEHWHDEDEVRLILEGRGLFHIHPVDGPVFAIEIQPGDLIRVPKGTHHWFDLCGERRIRAIRLFQNAAGWTPHYTGSGVDAGFQPVCFGPAYVRGTQPVAGA
jgi:1,2-dihydroxy-3-keto-5-methylthiopentene dioxygenase